MSTRRLRRIALNTAGIAVFVVSAFPVFWMISTAFKPNDEIFSSTPHPVPFHPTLHQFDFVINGGIAGVPFWHYFVNSLVVAVGTVVLSGLLALMAATAVARFRFRFRTTFLILLLVVQMVPSEALVIPMFINLRHLELLNSLIGLTAVYIGLALPFGTWMLRGFVAAVPKDWRTPRRSTARARSASSSASCCRSSHRASWRPASSPSSRPGTS